jgi:hypothetical protein
MRNVKLRAFFLQTYFMTDLGNINSLYSFPQFLAINMKSGRTTDQEFRHGGPG